MRTKYRTDHRFIALFLAVLMLLSSMRMLCFLIPTVSAAEEDNEEYTVRDDALHFIVRHWHTRYDVDATRQSEETQQEGESWFVVVEGYILKLKEGDEGYEEELLDENGNPLPMVDENGNELPTVDENGDQIYIHVDKSGNSVYTDVDGNYVDEKGNSVEEANVAGIKYGADGNPLKQVKHRYFRIVLVNQDDGSLSSVSKYPTEYVLDFDRVTGYLTLAIKPIREKNPLYGQPGYEDESEYIEYERYCGTSLSAGRSAINEQKDAEGNTTGITIKYGDGNTHIVKAHVFYNSWNKTVHGSADPVIFPDNEDEIDTAAVYTWAQEYNGHKVGDIIKYTDGGAESACYTEDDLKEAAAQLKPSNYTDDGFISDYFSAEPTPFYSTKEGLHTNKTLMQDDGTGRLFLAELETWYVEGSSADIAFVLDASGSMAFTADTPDILNVYHAIADRVGIKELADSSGSVYAYQYTSKAGDTYEWKNDSVPNDASSNYVELKAFITKLIDAEDGYDLLDEFVETINDKLESEFTRGSWEALWDKIGAVRTTNVSTSTQVDAYPQRDKLIGYYQFEGNNQTVNGSGYRTWTLNTVADGLNINTAADFMSQYSSLTEELGKQYFANNVNQGQSNGSFDFTQRNNTNNMYSGWAGSHSELNFSSGYGFNVGIKNDKGNDGTTDGLLLDKAPIGSFTLSFSFGLNNTVNKTSTAAEILYIGPLQGETSSAEFRMTNQDGALQIYSNGREIWNGNVPGETRVTLVYNSDSHKLAIYLGDALDSTVSLSLSGANIVFAPFANSYESPLYVDDVFLYDTNLDADGVSQLLSAYSKYPQNINATETVSAWNDVFILNSAALAVLLNPRNTAHVELGVAAYNYYVYQGGSTGEYAPLAYWDGKNTEKHKIGGTDQAFALLEDGSHVLGELNSATYVAGVSKAGWYFMSHAGSSTVIEYYFDIGTAKRLYALSSTTIQDNADLPGGGQDTIPTNNSYTTTKGETIRFYLDENGNLRCFYSTSASNTACSYVYELSDNQYVKTEKLQRALANFSAQLVEYSPTSMLSAVRFSAPLAKSEWDNLVLLDWTSDPSKFAGILSQKYGGGTASDHETSDNGMEQYNYVLTGGTHTYTGLGAYMDYLESNASTDPQVTKYLVIITDGADDGITANADGTYSYNDNVKTTQNYVNALKNKGYTIITIYLPGATALNDDGSIDRNDANYQKAYDFLTSLAGKTGTNQTDAEADGYFLATNDPQQLLDLFNDKILSQIVAPMEGYTVQDYIDPRFDLQEETFDENTSEEVDVIWHLNAGGQVVKAYTDGTVIETINVMDGDYTIHLTRECTPGARDPYLRYDDNKDMYYLEWLDQTIPTTPEGYTELLPVWTAKFLLRAKDDFIGGNAILTNGNGEKMNWVFHPADLSEASEQAYRAKLTAEFSYAFEHTLSELQRDDYVYKYAIRHSKTWEKWRDVPDDQRDAVIAAYASQKVAETVKATEHDASSGTGDMKRERPNGTYTDAYPSKGFPRTTANVSLLPITTGDISGVIYMGEVVSPTLLLADIEDQLDTESYYLDYLKRYAYQRSLNTGDKVWNLPLLDLLNEWLGLDSDQTDKEFSIPYMYLPAVEYDGATGNVKTDAAGNAVITNNVGTAANQADVVGILTYRWEQVETTPQSVSEPSADAVKTDTERLVYSLTVEYTPLRVGDTLKVLNDAVKADAEETTAEGISFIASAVADDGTEIPSRTRKGIFAKYIPIDGGNSAEFTDTYLFDRKQYVNNKLITDTSYKWNNSYKPEVYKTQLDTDGNYGSDKYPDVGATFLNSERTLTSFSKYTLDVVSGDIVLELKMLIGELKEAVEETTVKTETVDGVKHYKPTFELKATRKFTDTELVERIKSRAGNLWEDYGDTFTFTFELDLTDEQIEGLKAEAESDPDGYVTVYARAKTVKADFGSTTKTSETLEYGLPIGTYTFSLNKVNPLDTSLHFSTIETKDDVDSFKAAYGYFNGAVLRGLATTNENPLKYRRIGTIGDNPLYDGVWEEEITELNIGDYIADTSADTDNDTVTFYIGTDANDDDARRAVKDYTDYRLGIIRLSTGMTQLTITEKGGLSTETFFYHIHGTTLGGKPVDLTVSVQGGKSTTVDILPGDYTVDEISDWSWKYDNEDTYDTLHENGTDDEKYTREENGGDWNVTVEEGDTQYKSAYTELRHRAPDADGIQEHHYVTFEHGRNDKVWLGDESSQDNQFQK